MSSTGNMRLAFVIEAIDKATGTVGRINKTIDRITEPVRRVRLATAALIRESRFDRVSAAWAEMGERGQNLLGWGRAAGTMLLGLGLAGAGAAFGLKRTIDTIDQANDQAKKLGILTAEYQRLGYAAQMNGGSQEAMGQGLQFLSQNLSEAVNGSKEAAVWFARAGIPLQQLRTMNVVQVMEAIADRFQSVGDAGQNASKKIALTRALMGRGGADLVQTLNMGSEGLRRFYREADQLGGVVSEEAASGMADFNDEFDRMQFAVRGGMAAIATAVLPVFNDLVKRTTAWTVANRELVASGVAEFVQRILPRLPAFAESTMQVVGAVAALVMAADSVAQALGGWETVMAVVAGIILGKGLLAVFSLTTAVWGLGVALMATPFGWVAAGLAGLVAVGALVYSKWESIKGVFAGVSAWLKRIGESDAVQLMARLGGTQSMRDNARYVDGGQFLRSNFGTGAMRAAANGGAADLSGTLRIQVDSDGRARVAEARPAAGSPLSFDYYAGVPMAGQ